VKLIGEATGVAASAPLAMTEPIDLMSLDKAKLVARIAAVEERGIRRTTAEINTVRFSIARKPALTR
jgi:hypothetical protein